MSQVKMFTRLEDDVKQAEKVTGANPQNEELLKKRRDNPIDFESRVRQGINVIFKEPIHKLLARIRGKPYYRKLDPMGGHPKRHNQRLRCSFHEEKGHTTDSCRALNFFLDQLVQDGHLKECVDEEKTQVGKAIANPNPRFDRRDGDD